MEEDSTITVHDVNTESDVTFRATHWETSEYVPVTLLGDANIVLDQILVSPSGEFDGSIKNAVVDLGFQRSSEYDTRGGGMVVISAEDERRLVEWLHTQGADFKMKTDEWRRESMKDASHRGKCAGCPAYFKDGTTWAVTLHRDGGHDLHYCTKKCFENQQL